MQWFEQVRTVQWGQAGGVALGAYLVGCFTTGYYLVRWWSGRDLRQLGSGTVGARNAGRALGSQGLILTMLGDAAKGALAVAVTQYFTRDDRLAGLALVAVVIGHIWPAQLRFHGGKGVAASLGGLAMYDFRLALAVALIFALTYALVRKTVMSGLIAFACLPLIAVYLQSAMNGPGSDAPHLICVSLVAVLIVVAHRKNVVEGLSSFVERSNIRKHHPPEL